MEKKKEKVKKRHSADTEKSADRIAFLRGRPVRDRVISYDDLINLKITLTMYESIDDIIPEL